MEWLLVFLLGLALGLVVAWLLRRWYLAGRLGELVGDDLPEAPVARPHQHAFGKKDADGVRICRCGDRYMDDMR